MAIDYDLDLTEQTDFDKIGAGGKYVAPGWYHAAVDKVEFIDDGKKTASIKFEFQVLAGKNTDEIGKKVFENLYLSEKTRDRQALFAKRLGLIKPEHAGKRVSIDWEEAVDKQVVIHVKEEEYTKNDGTKAKSSKLDYAGIYEMNDPKVKDVPKDASGALVGSSASNKVDQFADL